MRMAPILRPAQVADDPAVADCPIRKKRMAQMQIKRPPEGGPLLSGIPYPASIDADQASPIASREALPPTAVVLMVRVFSVTKRLR